MTKVVHFKKEEFDVYIGRPTVYGNPWSTKEDSIAENIVETREEAVQNYYDWLRGVKHEDFAQEKRQKILDSIPILKGKRLGCWCKPKLCHGDALVAIIDNEDFNCIPEKQERETLF